MTAGPGSGKTFVITQRILYLIEVQKVSPTSILVLTFSRAAAKEMQQRFLKKSGGRYQGVTFGTLHSVFYQILNRNSGHSTLRIIEPSLKYKLIAAIIDRIFGDSVHTPGISKNTLTEYFMNAISVCKNQITQGSTYVDEIYPCEFSEILKLYDQYMKENHLMDFDDIIPNCMLLFRRNPSVTERYRKQFTNILVDEFQDLSLSQYEILMLLAGPSPNLFAVGDDDQSIYGFRGSFPGIFERIRKDLSNSDCPPLSVHLSVNYRCAEKIVAASNRLISENKHRIPKKIHADRKGGNVFIRGFETERDEYLSIIREIVSQKSNQPGKRKTIAVIFRTNHQAERFRNIFRKYLSDNDPEQSIKRTGDSAKLSFSEGTIRSLREYADIIYSYFKFARDLSAGKGMRSDLYKIMKPP